MSHATHINSAFATKAVISNASPARYVSSGSVLCLVHRKKCVAATISIGPASANRPPGSVCGLGLRDAVRVGECESELANGRTLLLAIAVETIATPTWRKTNPEDVRGAAIPGKRGTAT